MYGYGRIFIVVLPYTFICNSFVVKFQHILLVMELAKGGELFDHLVVHGEYSESKAKLIIMQLVNAIAFMHENGIAHRDLKVNFF